MRLHQIPLSASLQNIGALLAGGLVSFLFLTLSARAVRGPGPAPGYAAMRCAPGRSAAPFWIQASGHSSLDPPRAVGPERGLCIRSRGADRNGPAFQVGKPARVLRAESADRRAAVSPAGRLHERRLRHGRAARAVARGYRPGARRTVWGILTVLAVLSWAWLKSPEPVAQAEGILTLASASGTAGG